MLLLDAHNYGGLVSPVGGLLAAIAFLGIVLWGWSKHIEQQFDREPKPANVHGEPENDGASGCLLLLVVLLVLGLAIALSG
jgi:uncharacterized iron-regulated membrane protein